MCQSNTAKYLIFFLKEVANYLQPTQRVKVPKIVTAFEEFYASVISNNCPGKQTRFLSTLKNLAAACFPFSSR
jgi:hypothetical protein